MAGPVALEQMLAARTLWHAGRSAAIAVDGETTGFDPLDALLPQRGWPRRALTELLLPAAGVGELSLLLPTLARMTQAGGTVAVVAPPYVPYAAAWQAAGVALSQLHVVDASPNDALWAFEQCLRSGACAAVLGWPMTGDAQALRRLQVAADGGDCLGFALRDRRHARNPSPAALRLEAVRDARDGIVWQVRKCRGGAVPVRGFVQPLSQREAVAASLLPPLAGEGRDGGALRDEATSLRLAPTPTLPRKRGRELQREGIAASPLPPLAGEGRDGGAFRDEATSLRLAPTPALRKRGRELQREEVAALPLPPLAEGRDGGAFRDEAISLRLAPTTPTLPRVGGRESHRGRREGPREAGGRLRLVHDNTLVHEG